MSTLSISSSFCRCLHSLKQVRSYSTDPININTTQPGANDLESIERSIGCLFHVRNYERIAVYLNSSGGSGDPPSGARL